MSSSSDYKKVTMMMENPSYDGFLDGERSEGRRQTHHRMKPFVLVTLLLLAVVGVAIALAIVLTGDEENIEAPEALTILGNLHISNRDYKTKYANKNSKEFFEFEKEVVAAMDRVYNKTLFGNIYVGSSVTEIKKGSVIVNFEIHLEIPKVLFDTKTGGEKSVQALEYNNAYIHLVKAIDGDRLGDFKIIEFSLSFDSASLSFETISVPTSTPADNQLVATSPSTPATPDACDSNPCTNSGTCVTQTDPPYYSCQCAEGYSGDNCQNR